MKNGILVFCYIAISVEVFGQDINSDLKEIFLIVEKEEQPYSQDIKNELSEAFAAFDKKWESKINDEKAFDAIVGSRIARLDSALFSEKVVNESADLLIQFIEEDKLNSSPMLSMRIIGRFATKQPPVHPARVRVIEALVNDYLEENPPTTFDQLSASGYGFLPMIYKANGQIDKALTAYREYLRMIEENDMYVSKTNLYMDLIKMEVEAAQYDEALKSIASFRERFLKDTYNSFSTDLAILEASVSLKQGEDKNAIAVFDLEEERLIREDELVGEEAISFRFDLLLEVIRFSVSEGLGVESSYLDQLINHVKANQSYWKYGTMYYKTEELLTELNSNERLGELQKPE
ncbi:MAG: hypothetical protein AAFY41_07705 [Bacteroidota bacterium]